MRQTNAERSKTCSENVKPTASAENGNLRAVADGTETEAQSCTEWLDDTLYRVDCANGLTGALFALWPEHRLLAVETMLQQLEPDWPGVPFGPYLADARDWAAWASWLQRKALLLACYESLPVQDQLAFLAYIAPERRAAA